MFFENAPKTRQEAEIYRYNRWAGNPRGRAYQSTQCAMEVQETGRGGMFYQCCRKPGHGPDKLYCKQHANKISASTPTD